MKKVEDVLRFVEENATILVKYATKELSESLLKLNYSAQEMYEAIQKVKKMAFAVKGKAVNIRTWMKSFEHLDPKVVTEQHKETWKITLKDW